MRGLERIAFGDIGDVVKLLRRGDKMTQKELAELDLFSVADLRRNKDGAFEAKLYSRMEALKLLLEYSGRDAAEEQGDTLLAALEQSARQREAPEREGHGV